jgi:hypothetical protein
LGKRKERAAVPPSSRRIVAVSPDDGSAIALRQPELAAVLGWLLPGLGHLYQGRTWKGAISMGVVTTIFLAGLWLGSGRVVYASWRSDDTRWWFVPQRPSARRPFRRWFNRWRSMVVPANRSG